MVRRPPIPSTLKQEILYECAFACVVCQEKADHIHHIDKNNRNNDRSNLAALCQKHHDEAHTHRELSQNLSPARIKGFKVDWCTEVARRRAETVSVAVQRASALISVGVSWAYINHKRLTQVIDKGLLAQVDSDLFERCLFRSLVDKNGIIIKPKNRKVGATYLGNTIYDWFDYGDDHALHRLYSELTDLVAKKVQPIHLGKANWTKVFIKNTLQSGSYVFVSKSHYFKKISESRENAHVLAKTFRGNIRIEYYMDTMDMFGTTSITVSFSGHKFCSALLLVKSIEESGGKLTLHCTPLALGVGFQRGDLYGEF